PMVAGSNRARPWATMRAVESVWPPGGKGTTQRIARPSPNDCAWTERPSRGNPRPAARQRRRVRLMARSSEDETSDCGDCLGRVKKERVRYAHMLCAARTCDATWSLHGV